MKFAGDQLFDEPPSAIMGLDLVEMTVDNSRGVRLPLGSQNFPYLEGKLLERERLGNQLDAGIEHAIVYDRVASIA